MKRTVLFTLCILTLSTIARGEVGDPTIRTDHPQYAGEGAFQTIDDCVRFATAGKQSPQDKAIAQYLWLLTHEFHLMSPQESCVAGLLPNTANSGGPDLVVYDANRSRFSYGYGLCGTVHAWNEPYWNALGMRPRRRAFPGHVNSEILYDGSWHAFDTDMAGLVFRRDGVVAGYDDIIRDTSLLDVVRSPLPQYPFAWPSDFKGMKQGWQQVAAGGSWYKMYNSGYAAQPGIVHLRAGEAFTRYFDRDHWGGPSKRRFWHNLPGGPYRNWTFVNMGTPSHEGDKSNCRGNASYCNGEFVYRPDLAGGRYREGAAAQSANVAHRSQSPRLYSRDQQNASIVFQHFSPYVICGDPVDDANPMTGQATDGFIVEGTAAGGVTVEISADQGQSWQAAGSVTGRFRLDLTEAVKGRYGWQVRFTWQGAGGLDDVQFTTTTQVSQTIYPRLKPGGTQVTYRAASRGVVAVLPNFGLDESHAKAYEAVPLRSANVAYVGRGAKSSRAYETTDNKPGAVVFRIASPAPLTEVIAAVRYQVPVPPPANCEYRMEVSADGGRTWRAMARADIPADNEYSSGWLTGTADLSSAKANEALVRVHFYAGGHRTGLIDAQLYGLYPTAAPQPLTLTYAWKESGQLKTHEEPISAGLAEKTFTINTGQTLTDEFVRLTAP
jgi:hypothetical protein